MKIERNYNFISSMNLNLTKEGQQFRLEFLLCKFTWFLCSKYVWTSKWSDLNLIFFQVKVQARVNSDKQNNNANSLISRALNTGNIDIDNVPKTISAKWFKRKSMHPRIKKKFMGTSYLILYITCTLRCSIGFIELSSTRSYSWPGKLALL